MSKNNVVLSKWAEDFIAIYPTIESLTKYRREQDDRRTINQDRN
jgi:hypothetical protein